MPEDDRIVACFRWRGAASLAERVAEYASAAEAVFTRAEDLGAQLVAWHAASFAVAFPKDGVERLVELITADDSAALGFSVGIAEGPLSEVGGTGRMTYAWGQCLVMAWALARVARSGEVLLDPAVSAVQDERLLVRGSRIGLLGEARVRGVRLDLRHPFQPARGFPTIALVRTPFLGREPVAPPPGTLGLVTGRRGSGGTRWLEELAARERERRTLWLRPRLGEPLGSLRRALARAEEAQAELDPELGASLGSVLAGEGLDLDTASHLLSALLRREDSTGLILIDDVEQIDFDSLEAVVHASKSGAFAVVARAVDGLALPEALAFLPTAFEVELTPFPRETAEELARELSSGRLRGSEATAWAKRGGGLALGVVAALADALESGELVLREDATTTRSVKAESFAPQQLISRRVRRWDAGVRSVLGALAVLGGDSDEEEIAALLGMLKQAPPAEETLHGLEAGDLLRRDGRRLTLPSATLRFVLNDALAEAERARLHRAAAAVLAGADLPMCSVAASVHSMLGGDVDRALPLARRSAGALRAGGLEDTARALEAFSETGDPALVHRRGLFGGAKSERAGLQRSDVPPPLSMQPAPITDRPSRAPPPSGEEAGKRFVQALRLGDHAAMEVLASELRDDGAQHVVADRLEGMACLARGQLTDALRRLRQAKDGARKLEPRAQSRAALALGVALASAGRGTEALLEGLEALARARAADDSRGEAACARFLAQLSAAAGSDAAASRWTRVVEQTTQV
ncbi:MAG: hypothetical protein IPI67_15245 [Myxococcales bacterium]|nr:hypothetical protein [Myxococcales bacterium]